MDKNTITGFVLIAIVFIGFTYFSQPSKEELSRQRAQDSLTTVNAQKQLALQKQETAKQQSTTKEDSVALSKDTTSLFGLSKCGLNKTIILQNELVKVDLNTLGGSITAAQLKKYKNQQKKPVELFNSKTSRVNFTIPLKEENLRTSELFFTPKEVTDSTVTMLLTAKDGSSLKFMYKLIPHTYMVNFTVQSEGLEKHIMPNINTLSIEWQDSVKQQEKGYTFENRYSTLTYKKKGSSTDYLNETKEKEEEEKDPLDWVAYKNQFFSYVFISYDGFSKAKLKSTPLTKESGYLKYYESSMQTFFDPTGKTSSRMQIYMGPNKFRLLQHMNNYSLDKGKNLDLEHLVYLGWPLFRYINRYFTIYVFDWLTKLGIPMGLVLLLITILLKLLVYPTTKKSYMSSARMRVLKPKLDEIGAKYPNKEDNMKKQQEIMATYSKYGVNPVGGCLPILLQTPIWIAMFNFVPNAIELRQQSFLWASDLSTYDDVIRWGHPIWLIGDHLSIFCLLFCGTNLLYSWINMKMQKESMVGEQADQMKMMQWMMMLMPLFFFFMFNDYSSGLNYYYFISLLCSALTMWWLRFRTDDKRLLAKLEENYKKNVNNPEKMKGMAARLEALQKQQELQKQKTKR
ncbi:MAG: membrane protein insertase YidC [Bacteroidaceae bacterium]|jgi:YidC/Oxa1 family membrane protein insertase